MLYTFLYCIIENMDTNKIIIRSSSLNDFTDCSRRAATKIIPKIVKAAGFKLQEMKNGAPALIGTAAHKVMEFTLTEKIKTGEIGLWRDAKESALEEWLKISTAGELTWDEKTPNNKTAEQQITAIGATYFNHIAPNRNPVATEIYFEANAGDGFLLTGHADDLEADGVLRDFKTGANNSNYSAQLGAYSLLARSNGHKIAGLGVDWVPRSRAGVVPEFMEKEYNVAASENVAQNILSNIKNSIKNFRENGNPWAFLANPSSRLCSAKFCPAYGTDFCDYTKAAK